MHSREHFHVCIRAGNIHRQDVCNVLRESGKLAQGHQLDQASNAGLKALACNAAQPCTVISASCSSKPCELLAVSTAAKAAGARLPISLWLGVQDCNRQLADGNSGGLFRSRAGHQLGAVHDEQLGALLPGHCPG